MSIWVFQHIFGLSKLKAKDQKKTKEEVVRKDLPEHLKPLDVEDEAFLKREVEEKGYFLPVVLIFTPP